MSCVQKVDVPCHKKDVIRCSTHGGLGLLGRMLPNTAIDRLTETMTESNGFYKDFSQIKETNLKMCPNVQFPSHRAEKTLPYSSHSQTTSGSQVQCIASRFWPVWNEDNDNRTQFELMSFIMRRKCFAAYWLSLYMYDQNRSRRHSSAEWILAQCRSKIILRVSIEKNCWQTLTYLNFRRNRENFWTRSFIAVTPGNRHSWTVTSLLSTHSIAGYFSSFNSLTTGHRTLFIRSNKRKVINLTTCFRLYKEFGFPPTI